MLKTKQTKFGLVAIVIFSLMAMYGATPLVKAATLDSAKDTISDSDIGADDVTHTIVFNAGPDLTVGTVIQVTFNANFTGIDSGNLTCPSDATEGGAGQSVTCTVVSDLASNTAHTITLTNVDNPDSAGDFDVTISHNQLGENESTEMLVYIIADVSVTAHVNATLTFAIGTTTPEDTINGITVTATSSPVSLAYGTIEYGTRYLMGHTLAVTTNAADGFVVTVQQDMNMKTAADADIDSFSTSSPAAWGPPTPDVSDENSWGWMGVTTEDDDSGFGNGADTYQGLDDTAPLQVFAHDGPADGSTDDAGDTKVGYSIAITSLQEAGDYENTLTYICTPTY
ncbi:MAG: hypothetical protein MUC28_02590 [Planctomycetes bacterium]|jgi:hypothetical protein|nr:hypothetical protein [Planctomycetota bacterium]